LSPYVCTEYLTTAKDLPIRYLDDGFDFKIFEGLSFDEFLDATKGVPVERQAALIERFQLQQTGGSVDLLPQDGGDVKQGSSMSDFAAEVEQEDVRPKVRAPKSRGGVPIKEEKKDNS